MSTQAGAARDNRKQRDLRERLRLRLEHLQTQEPEEISPQRWAFRRAAALLTSFDPVHLRAVAPDGPSDDASDEAPDGGALVELVDDCLSLGNPEQRVWTLEPQVRATTLRTMQGRREALRALAANPPGPEDAVERAARAYLRGAAPPLESQSLDELAATLQAVRWLSEIRGVHGIPAPERVALVHQRKQLFEPLESLLQGRFHGREDELAELRLHVGVLEPSTVGAKLRHAGRKALRSSGVVQQPPLMIHGPGGIGKSTLLARFVEDHARAPDAARIPFVYVDFERPTLSDLEPATLLVEAARQLAIQYPDAAAELHDLEAEAAREAARQRRSQLELDELEEISAAKATVHRDLGHALRAEGREHEHELVGRLATAVRAAVTSHALAPDGEVPLLVVLDSFEEAQYRSSPYLHHLWDMFDALQDAYPMVRVVVSGRVPVEELAVNQRSARHLALAEFDLEAAVGFLAAHGIQDRQIGRALAKRFGGNPLSLKLAARLTRASGLRTDWIRDVRTRRWLFAAIDESLIQSQLYQRILGSILDDDLRPLAHPGLVLRRITPDVIFEVLAEPCGVDVPDHQRADELFELFARKVDLVQRVGPKTLAHRSDVRRVMLRLIEQQVEPRLIEDIERRAVAFYTDRDGPEARAEEIYHRLRLGERPRSVAARWEPGVEAFLHGAQQEVPAQAEGFLAAMLGDGRVSPEILGQADLADWESLTAREVEDLLDQACGDEELRRNAQAALELMRTRRERSPGSPLFRLEAEALAQLGHLETAERVVGQGIASIEDARVPTGTGIRERLLDLLLLAAKLLEDRQLWQPADRELERAERLAERLGRRLDVLGTLLYRMHLRHARQLDGDDGDALRERTARQFLQLSDSALRRQPALVRSTALEIGAADGDVLKRAVDLLGLEVSDAAQTDALAQAILDLCRRRSDVEPWLREYAALRGVRIRELEPGICALITRVAGTKRIDEIAAVLIAQSSSGSDVRRLLARMLPTTDTGARLEELRPTPGSAWAAGNPVPRDSGGDP